MNKKLTYKEKKMIKAFGPEYRKNRIGVRRDSYLANWLDRMGIRICTRQARRIIYGK